MVELKSRAELDAMRQAGLVVARALDAAQAAARPGVTLAELDAVAADVISAAGAKSSFLGYHPHFAPSPFPGVICASVNDAVIHGIPDGRVLADGDVLGIDCGAEVDGFHGDAAVTVCVGRPNAADQRLVDTTRHALYSAIDTARPGNRLGDVSATVGAVGRAAGYGIPAGFGGHGVGRRMHESPEVPNTGTRGRGLPLQPGLVIAIEPMFISGGQDDYYMAPDGWAMHTADGSRAAHFEHTVAITDNGPVVLTAGNDQD